MPLLDECPLTLAALLSAVHIRSNLPLWVCKHMRNLVKRARDNLLKHRRKKRGDRKSLTHGWARFQSGCVRLRADRILGLHFAFNLQIIWKTWPA